VNVFLTGATGYIGSVVAEQLIAHGHTVIGLARTDSAAAKLADKGVTALRGGLPDLATLADAVTRADAVIHAASTNDANAPAADRAAVEAMLAALAGSNKPFIYTSGYWVLGNTGDRPADEEAPLNPTPLVAWRPAVEHLVLTAAARQVRSVVLRPVIVYGRAGGIPAGLVADGRQHGVVQFVGDGEQLWPTVHIDDLGDLYVRLLSGAGAGSLWHAAHGESLRVREIALAASQGAGVSGMIKSWPLDEARKVLGPYADALALSGRVSGKRAERLLGWKPSGPSLIEELSQGSYAL
jgi:nucleoside-diphosphate-sugar epimerase